MPHWIDAHNHLQDPRLPSGERIIADMRSMGVVKCVVNATREADWRAVADLAANHPDFIAPAFGIHPWHAHLAGDGWEEQLDGFLTEFPQASIGECGLDGWVSEPSIEVQLPVFAAQLRLARKRMRPITIHCLKAWEPLFQLFSEIPPPPGFLMHSFGGSIEIARRLIPMGACFSFSGYFLQARKSAVIEVFRQLPRDRILLETDAPDMLPPDDFIIHSLKEGSNHPANLPAIGAALAEKLGMTVENLAELSGRNARRCFGL